MAGGRKPMQVNLATGGKHWTKEEIKRRLEGEVQPIPDGVAAPAFLTAKQKKEFNRIAEQLTRLGIMGETDCDTLARYVVAQDLYTQAIKDLRKLAKDRPKKEEKDNDPDAYMHRLEVYYIMMDNAVKRQDRYFKQAQTVAAALGLTISSRCKLIVPVKEEAPKVNKFARFGMAAGNE